MLILPETIHRLAARRTKKQGYKTALYYSTSELTMNSRIRSLSLVGLAILTQSLSSRKMRMDWPNSTEPISMNTRIRAAAGLQHLAAGRLVRHSTAGPKPRNCGSVEKLAWHPRAKHENSGADQNAEAAQQHVGRRRQQEHGRRAKTTR